MTKSTSPAGARPRIAGVDAARGLALLGMMATHIVPLSAVPAAAEISASALALPAPTWAAVLFAGKASALFALLAGVGLALLTGGERPHSPERLARTRRGVAVRAGLIAAIGMVCGMLATNVAVILVHYGLLFLLAIPFLRAGPRALAGWAAGWLLLSPALLFVLQPLAAAWVDPPDVGGSPWFGDLARPATLLSDLLVAGYYPVVVWTGFILLGLYIGRLPLNRPPVALALLAGGALLAAAARWASEALVSLPAAAAALRRAAGLDADGLELALATGQGLRGMEPTPWWFALSAPHTGAPLDLVHAGATAAAVLGACQLLSIGLQALLGRLGEGLLWPLAGAGAATLTLYTAHLVALDLLSVATAGMPRLELYLWYAAVALLVGIALKWAGSRGPLEKLVHAAATGAAGGTPKARAK